MKFNTGAFVVVLICSLCSGQSQTRVPSTNVSGSEYPRLNEDLSATFRVQADNAQKVQLLMDLGQATYDMTKGADGFSEVTTKPLLPGFHYYLISVDGFAPTDPGSKTFFESSGTSPRQQATGEESLFTRPPHTRRAINATRSYTFSTDGAKTRPLGVTRDMRISFSTI